MPPPSQVKLCAEENTTDDPLNMTSAFFVYHTFPDTKNSIFEYYDCCYCYHCSGGTQTRFHDSKMETYHNKFEARETEDAAYA